MFFTLGQKYIFPRSVNGSHYKKTQTHLDLNLKMDNAKCIPLRCSYIAFRGMDQD